MKRERIVLDKSDQRLSAKRRILGPVVRKEGHQTSHDEILAPQAVAGRYGKNRDRLGLLSGGRTCERHHYVEDKECGN